MIRVDKGLRAEGLQSKLLLQVHDELVLDQAPGEDKVLGDLVRREMIGAGSLLVPLVVDLGRGPDWLSAH
jgi:DNA polymerase-1